MENVKGLKQVYDIFLSVPGMNESVKLDQKVSRKNLLLLAQLIQKGLAKKEGAVSDLLEVMGKESIDALAEIATEFLQKAGLTELNEKLAHI